MSPYIIQGNNHKDNRGTISFVNDFSFDNIVRFYIIENSEENKLRAWQGHKLDTKYFYCIKGVFQISYVKVDDWVKPSSSLTVESIVLDETDNKILCIPSGYANAIKSLSLGSKLLSFSTLPLSMVKDDDFRYDKNFWVIK